MTSKIAVLIPDMAFVAFTTMLILWIGGLPLHWLLDLVDLARVELHWLAMLVVFAALWLMRAIATSESAPRRSPGASRKPRLIGRPHGKGKRRGFPRRFWLSVKVVQA
jgi:hypothetical protein